MLRAFVSGLAAVAALLAMLAALGALLGWIGWEVGHLGGASNPADGAGFVLAFLGCPLSVPAFAVGAIIGYMTRKQ